MNTLSIITSDWKSVGSMFAPKASTIVNVDDKIFWLVCIASVKRLALKSLIPPPALPDSTIKLFKSLTKPEEDVSQNISKADTVGAVSNTASSFILL